MCAAVSPASLLLWEWSVRLWRVRLLSQVRQGGAPEVRGSLGYLREVRWGPPMFEDLPWVSPHSLLSDRAIRPCWQGPAGQWGPVASPASSPSSTEGRPTAAVSPGTATPASPGAPPGWTVRAGWRTTPGATVARAVRAPVRNIQYFLRK